VTTTRKRIVIGIAAAALGTGLMSIPVAQAATGGHSATHSVKRAAWTYNGNCQTWHDGYTWGAECDGGPYVAKATCFKGPFPWNTTDVYSGDGYNHQWVYAYCSSVQGTYDWGDVVHG